MDWPALLERAYPDNHDLEDHVRELLEIEHHGQSPAAQDHWSERDAWLITYADQFHGADHNPLASLHTFSSHISGRGSTGFTSCRSTRGPLTTGTACSTTPPSMSATARGRMLSA